MPTVGSFFFLAATILSMPPAPEVEVKLRVSDLNALSRKLSASGFKLITARTHELNTLYDFPDGRLRSRGEILRIRRYGHKWTLTHKGKGNTGKHKSRMETETQVEDGEALAHIFESLGLARSFRYEKYRAEWTDGEGHVVLDETPIGNIAELEGTPEWIDRTAARLEIKESEYITLSYGQMFSEWRTKTGSRAREMTWAEIEKT
ncbi:MAG TPA: class IV adenylate cyclase [Terriglobales bacterium]|nr:class IV adenylate cyclase [Terriglobales bacterium]